MNTAPATTARGGKLDNKSLGELARERQQRQQGSGAKLNPALSVQQAAKTKTYTAAKEPSMGDKISDFFGFGAFSSSSSSSSSASASANDKKDKPTSQQAKGKPKMKGIGVCRQTHIAVFLFLSTCPYLAITLSFHTQIHTQIEIHTYM
jgi:hypothetical protein